MRVTIVRGTPRNEVYAPCACPCHPLELNQGMRIERFRDSLVVLWNLNREQQKSRSPNTHPNGTSYAQYPKRPGRESNWISPHLPFPLAGPLVALPTV